MGRIALIFLIAVTAASAQNSRANGQVVASSFKAETSRASLANSTAAKLAKYTTAANNPVITIHGLCGGAAKQTKATCATVITRREFESFIDVMNATTTRGIDPAFYRNMAEGNTALLVNADAGQKARVDKDPRFQALLEITRLRALGGMYRSRTFNEAVRVPAEEIEAYYKKNIDSFEEVDLDRFLVAKNNPMNLEDAEYREKAKRIADEMQARAAKGEDIAQLEKEALAQLGNTTLPIIAVGVRRGQLDDKANEEIFNLGPGQVTSVLDGRGLWMFFKRTGRQVLSVDTVSPEIKGKLLRDKIDSVEKTLHDKVHVDYSNAYFGPEPGAKGEAAANTKTAEVGPKDAIMTIHGLCDTAGKQDSADGCTLRITREAFEPTLAIALLAPTQGAPPSTRNIAKDYVDTLIYGYAGKRAGLENDSHYEDVMALARKRALGDMYRLKMNQEALQVPSAAIQAFYGKNLRRFDEVTLSHVSVPKQDPKNPNDLAFKKKAERLAAELHQRAIRGEAPDKLQREAYSELGLKNPPASLMQPIRRGALEQKTEQEIYALKPGGVTTIKDIPSAYVFYRLESRRTVPLQEATPEISYLLYRQRLGKFAKALTGSLRAEYNEKYFSAVDHAAPLSASAEAQTLRKTTETR